MRGERRERERETRVRGEAGNGREREKGTISLCQLLSHIHVIKYGAPLTGLTHSLRVLGLAQNLQQVIVGQEVEPWEELPLGLQIHVQ